MPSGLTLVTISHLLPIAMAYELVPGYTNATAPSRPSIAITIQAFAIASLILN